MESISLRENEREGGKEPVDLLFFEEQNKRNEDLINFIDEFVNSEEYKEYLEMKQNIIKRSISVQYCEDDLIEYEEFEEDKYPLTTKSKKMMAFISKFEKYTKNRENLEVLRKQERGIQIIKDKIVEVGKIFFCTKQIRENAKNKRDRNNLEEICQSFNIDYRIWKDKYKHKITHRILCYQKILHSRKIKKYQNVTAIVKKLVEEIRHRRESSGDTRKILNNKIEMREKIMEDMEVIGHHITLCSRYKAKEDIDADQDVDIESIIEESKKNFTEASKTKQKKGKTAKVKKDKREGKKSTITKGSKKSQKSKKEKSGMNIPIVPICNERNIISTDHIEKIDQLIHIFNKLDDIMEDTHLLTQIKPVQLTAETNGKFLCKPKMITFNNFMNGKNYSKNLLILNKSKATQKLRLVGISSVQEYNVLLFKTQPLLGIQKLASGCSIIVTIFFAPIEEICEIEATLEFRTFDIESQKQESFYVNIKCIPSHADLKMNSNEICFGKISFWQKDKHIKVLKLKNKGTEPCTAVFKKIHDSLDLPQANQIELKMEENDTNNGVLEECDIIHEVIEEVLENVFSTFSFEHLSVKLKSSQNMDLKIQMKNFDYIGNYLEKYLVDVYENNSHVGNKEIVLYAEVTGHFITVSPEILDFGVCVVNSVYQLGLNINNNSSTTQAVAIKFPSSLADYIRSDVANLYVPPQATRKIWVKFLPRKTLLSGSEIHFDKQTALLEFPIHVCTMSKNYRPIPPVKAKVFAVLTETNNIVITVKNDDFRRAVANLGECSIYETIITDLVIENRTLSPQIYGFVSLPRNMTLSPNFGYGMLGPEETRTLTLSYHPDISDLKKFFSEEKFHNFQETFEIHLDTITNLGQIKQELCTKKLRKSIDIILRELKTPQENILFRNIMELKDVVRLEYFQETDYYAEDLEKQQIANECSEANFFPKYAISKPVTGTNMMYISARILRPLLELSCQYVELPDTPCGSYSFVEIELKALNSECTLECDFLRKNSTTLPNYEAWFKITGDNEEIRIEPSCGTLKNGETKKLILVANPAIPDSIIQDTARSIKYTEIYEKRKQDFALRKMKSHSKGKTKKNKMKNTKEKLETKTKQKKSRSKSKTKTTKETKGKKSGNISKSDQNVDAAEIEVRDSDIILSYLDYYPAEMCYWRTLEPYVIQSKMVCIIDYDSPLMIRKQETIYLDVSVRVVRPDFIANLKTQRINFGNVALGMGNTEYIILQNIKYNTVKPKMTLLNPTGPFRITYLRDTNVPPEHYLKLPVIFEPIENGQVEEYFEITSGRTRLSLILQGQGVTPEIDFKPNNSVFRLESSKNKAAQCNLQIINRTNAKLVINFEKVVELEGFFRDIVQSKLKIDKTQDNVDKAKKGHKGKKSEKKSEKKKQRSPKVEASSNILTEVEKHSISNNFVKIEDSSFFDILNVEDNQVNLKENSSTSIKFGFGTNEALMKMKKEMKAIGKKGKASKNPSEKKSSKSSKNSKKSADQKHYVVKYNIKLGNNFLKDIILICSFK